jgi:hypothetical protein
MRFIGCRGEPTWKYNWRAGSSPLLHHPLGGNCGPVASQYAVRLPARSDPIRCEITIPAPGCRIDSSRSYALVGSRINQARDVTDDLSHLLGYQGNRALPSALFTQVA